MGSGSGGDSADTTGRADDSTTEDQVTSLTGSAPGEESSLDGGNSATGDTGSDTGGGDTSESEAGEDDTTTGAVVSCARTHEIVALAEDALLTGDWTLERSRLGEGMFANPNGNEAQGAQGTITFGVDVPCADDWYVWIRFYDWGWRDSWYVRVDGEPGPKQAIAEGDCTDSGNNWSWALMNYRELDAPECQYLYDPWVQTWDAGEHTVEFEILEHASLARIVVVNDPAFVP